MHCTIRHSLKSCVFIKGSNQVTKLLTAVPKEEAFELLTPTEVASDVAAVPAYPAITEISCVIIINTNETIADTIWLSVIADANKPIVINMKAIKKNTIIVPKSPTLNVPPQEIVTITWMITLMNMS